jgi:hypothetical protein
MEEVEEDNQRNAKGEGSQAQMDSRQDFFQACWNIIRKTFGKL